MWTQITVAVITGLVAGLGSALLTTRLQHHFWKLQPEDERRFWKLQRSVPTARPHPRHPAPLGCRGLTR